MLRESIKVFCAVTLVACGSANPSVYLGETGRPVALKLIDGVPVVQVRFVDMGQGALIIDSATPVTLISDSAIPRADNGMINDQLEGLGPIFPQFEAPVVPLFTNSDWPCAGAVPLGLLGADILALFRVHLDYQDHQITLEQPDTNRTAEFSSGEPVYDVAFDLRGGGRLRLGSVERHVGPTRIITAIDVDEEQVLGLLDTAAATTLIADDLYTRLPAEGRPTNCCVSVGGPSMTHSPATLTRLRRVRIGQAEARNVAALVPSDGALFEELSKEIGRPLSVIVGSNLLRRFRHQIDYTRRTWRLQAIAPPDSGLDRFVGPGFSYCRSREESSALLVRDVYRGSDAEAQGVRSGDTVVSVDGQAIAALADDEMYRLLNTQRDTPVPLEIRRKGANVRYRIRVEDALPSFAEPVR